MSGERPFGADELGPTQGSELDDAMEAVRALEAVADDSAVRTGPAFTDRVMAALADEPSPAPVGFLAPLRRRGLLAGFGDSVRQAWASIGTGRPAFARAAALAYVLVVALAGTSLAGAATFGVAGALGLLGHETAAPSPEPTAPPVMTPMPSLAAPPSVEPSQTPEPSDSAEPSDDHGGGGAEPSNDHGGGGAEPSDDHSGSGSGGGGSDDGSGGSGGGSGPSSTDGHGGSDDGSGSGGGSGGGGTDD